MIFDVDGTLVDSVDFHAQAWQRAFRKFGKEVPFVDVRQQIGKGGDQLMPVFFSKEELDEFGEEMEQYRSELYRTELMPRVRPFPQVRELFERVRAKGLAIALGSSAAEQELNFYVELLNIRDLVNVSTSADDADRSKPHPDIFEAALAQVPGVEAREAVVVGDTPYDAEAALRAGSRCIGVTCGGWQEPKLRESGCVEVYGDPAELLERFDSSLPGRNAARLQAA